MSFVDEEQMTHWEGCEIEHPECARVLAEQLFGQVVIEPDGSEWVPLHDALLSAITLRYLSDRLMEVRELAIITRNHYGLSMSYPHEMLTHIIEATDIVAQVEVPHG